MEKIMKIFISIIISVCFIFGIEAQEAYERFIGLGNCCVTRTQINHHLSKRFNKDFGEFGGGQLFDWLVIHDYSLMADAIDNSLDDLFEKEDLRLMTSWANGYDCVKNIRYNMTWNHLFDRDNSFEGGINPNILETEYNNARSKINYMSDKFYDLRHYKTLYIVAYPFHECHSLLTIEPTLEDLLKLSRAISKYRGNNDFKILYVPKVKKFESHKKIIVHEINLVSTPFVGNFEEWDLMLYEFDFKIE